MLQAILNKSWRQHPTKQQLYSHLPPIMKTIPVRWTRYAGHSWRNEDELISNILQWTPSHRQAKAGQPTRTYIQQLCADTGYSLEDLPEGMDDRDGWWERVKEICPGSLTWQWRWWWWWWFEFRSINSFKKEQFPFEANKECLCFDGIDSIFSKENFSNRFFKIKFADLNHFEL